MTGERRPRRRPGENRERLIEAGITVFGAQGYHGSSTGSVAALAEVPQPHVYANFHTKRDLFMECFARVAHELSETPAASTVSQAKAPRAGRRTAATAHIDGLALFLLQAIVVARDPELGDELLSALHLLRKETGKAAFEALLLRGAQQLL